MASLPGSCVVLVIVIAACLANEQDDKAIVEYLAKNTFSSGIAEYVFVLDRSGSVGNTNFETQKGFVESFLTHVVVDVNASRVAVISYSETAGMFDHFFTKSYICMSFNGL
ncbi:hypothetical protein JTE90_004141 [Oedothorax gibbosus]|uniref:VWFA domain-containing protein n=1 Tax=Oedothorax gibbosus TaxID=931172 RepID=A0AAV6UD57_9ARAC|nr:hypothetical protein JTE90_004141 [Oedothorax gibbosus]